MGNDMKNNPSKLDITERTKNFSEDHLLIKILMQFSIFSNTEKQKIALYSLTSLFKN